METSVKQWNKAPPSMGMWSLECAGFCWRAWGQTGSKTMLETITWHSSSCSGLQALLSGCIAEKKCFPRDAPTATVCSWRPCCMYDANKLALRGLSSLQQQYELVTMGKKASIAWICGTQSPTMWATEFPPHWEEYHASLLVGKKKHGRSVVRGHKTAQSQTATQYKGQSRLG